MARLLNAARAKCGPPGICKREGLPIPTKRVVGHLYFLPHHDLHIRLLITQNANKSKAFNNTSSKAIREAYKYSNLRHVKGISRVHGAPSTSSTREIKTTLQTVTQSHRISLPKQDTFNLKRKPFQNVSQWKEVTELLIST